MKKAVKYSLGITIIAIMFYVIIFAIKKEFPAVNQTIPFTGKAFPLEISRAYDIPVLFPFFLSMVMFVLFLKNMEDKNNKLYRKVSLGLTVSMILSIMFAIQISPISGLIAGLTLCFMFGIIFHTEFVIITALAFGLFAWVIAAIDSGLLLGAIPALTACLLFGGVAFLGFGLKKVLSYKIKNIKI